MWRTDAADDLFEVCNQKGGVYAWRPLDTAGGGGGTQTTDRPATFMGTSVGGVATEATLAFGSEIVTRYANIPDGILRCGFYQYYVPTELASTPAWNLVLVHKAGAGTGGNARISTLASMKDDNTTWDDAGTLIFATANVVVRTSANLSRTVLSGTNFDSALTMTANRWMVITVCRDSTEGGNLDQLDADWNLLQVLVRHSVN